MMEGFAAFHFLRPGWLWGFVPLAWAVYRAHKGRRAAGDWAAACDPELLRVLLQRTGNVRSGAPMIALAGTLVLLALAGPVWERLPQPLVRDDKALVVVLDLSRSMDVRDLQPSRLERVRYRLLDLLEAHEVGYAALVAYAGQPFLVSPLTDDFATIMSQLQALSTSAMPAGGSRADLAMTYASRLLQNAGHDRGEVLLVSDALGRAAAARARAGELAGRNYRVSVLGVGTLAGGPVPDPQGGFVRDAGGAIVITRLQRQALQAVAAAGKGAYWELGVNDVGMNFAFTAGAGREETEPSATDRWREYGPWLLLPLLLLCALAFRRGGALAVILLGCTLGLPGTAQALSWADLWSRQDRQAERLFHEEQWQEAAQRFRDPLWQAAAHYKAQDYEEALAALEDVEVGARGRYLRANAYAMLERYAEAEASYRAVLEAEDADERLREDARHNLAQVQRQQQRDTEAGAGEPGDGAEQGEQDTGEGEDGAQTAQGEQGEASESAGQGETASEESSAQQQSEAAGDAPGDSTAGENAVAAGGSGTGDPQDEQDPAGRTAGTGAEDSEEDMQQQAAVTGPRTPEEEAAGPRADESLDEEEDSLTAAAALQQREDAIQALRQRELDLATEAWLRSIRGDTGNYLRRKFHRQYQRMQEKSDEAQDW